MRKSWISWVMMTVMFIFRTPFSWVEFIYTALPEVGYPCFAVWDGLFEWDEKGVLIIEGLAGRLQEVWWDEMDFSGKVWYSWGSMI